MDAKYPAIIFIYTLLLIMKKTILIAILLLHINFIYAHVGNSNTTLEGMAGPYHVLINIKAPDVIPGTASLTLFTSNDAGIKIYARPVYFYSGEYGAPDADALTAVPNSPGQYEGTLWLMNNGSASIELSIEGPLGKGKMLVPVVAISTTTQALPASTKYMLIGLGVFLFILMITIVGASVSDGITKAGATVHAGSKRAKTMGFIIATLLCSALVYGGNRWWTSVAEKTSEFVFKPMHATYHLNKKDGRNELNFTIDTTNSQRSQLLHYIIPDHGKIMHFFIISIPDMHVFAHLHPERVGPINFSVNIPNVPAGKYLAFADIVYNSGFTETIKDTVDINEQALTNDSTGTASILDADDALDISHPLKTGNAATINNVTIDKHTGEVVTMNDGTKILLEGLKNNKYYFSNQLYSLPFYFYNKNNQPIAPDLYMGMEGHLIIVRIDGKVFSHVHPVGTYSMAAQTNLSDRMNLGQNIYRDPNGIRFRDSVDEVIKTLQNMPEAQREDLLMKEMKMPGMDSMNMNSNHSMKGMNMHMHIDNTVSFPYTFPSPGTYRIWVEMKKDGRIYTAVFDREVK
jgi:hypothetical protein